MRNKKAFFPYILIFYYIKQIDNGNIANQIHGFTMDYGKFILNTIVITLEDIVTHFAC